MGNTLDLAVLRNSERFKTIYVMAPMTMYGKKSLLNRKVFLERILPEAELIYPDGLFSCNLDWLKQIDGIVEVSDCGILLSPKNRIVGFGCFFEINLLKQFEKPVFYLDYPEKILTQEFFLARLPGDDWTFYAFVEFHRFDSK